MIRFPSLICDSILDATDPDKEAIGAPGFAVAHAVLTMQRCTVFGIVDVHAVELAENCIFNGLRERGAPSARLHAVLLRASRLPHATPLPLPARPGRAGRAWKRSPDPAEQAEAIAGERVRVRPQFTERQVRAIPGTPASADLRGGDQARRRG